MRSGRAPHSSSRMRSLAARVRWATARSAGWDLLTQLALGSPAGRALLSLAEALLRTRDAGNADRLIREQLARVQAATARAVGAAVALALRAGRAQRSMRARRRQPAARPWAALARRCVRGGLRAAMGVLGGRFIFAANIEAGAATCAARAGAGRSATRSICWARRH